MEYGDVVKRLAPCGLDCARCADYENGEIRQLSARLLTLLGNYKRLAELKKERNPAFENYDHFVDVLTAFASAACSGCRGDHVTCPLQTCSAKACQREKGVDFCFQCAAYPCEQQFSGRLRDRWMDINDRMKAMGVVEYYLEQLKQPRY